MRDIADLYRYIWASWNAYVRNPGDDGAERVEHVRSRDLFDRRNGYALLTLHIAETVPRRSSHVLPYVDECAFRLFWAL